MTRKQLSLALSTLALVLLSSSLAYPTRRPEIFNQAYTILTRWHLTALNDHLTSQTSDEQPAGSFEGQLFYVPTTHLKGTKRLFRNTLQAGTRTDHMDSNIEGDKGYRSEGPLGHTFKIGPQDRDDRDGMAPIDRWIHPTTLDHLTAFKDEDPSAAGFVSEGPQGYGYPRFGLGCEDLVRISGGGITIWANRVAGGAIARLEWNGMQFVNAYDYGRQIQTAINFQIEGEIDNPTEAGSKYGCPGVMSPGRAQGSPLLSLNRRRRFQTLETVTAPLQWNPDLFGGDADHPVVWSGLISKKIELNYLGHPNRIKWTTTIGFPRAREHAGVEIVTAYLRGRFNTFHFWKFNPERLYKGEKGKGKLIHATPPKGDCVSQTRNRFRGVIISTEDGAYALGAYRPGGTKSMFTLCDFLGEPGRDGVFDVGTSKLSVIRADPRKGVEPGMREWVTFLVVGDRPTVRLEMEAMAREGFGED
ncbi:MAG: hypothetical protein V3S30_11120 [Thermoanaerobaculia bacterium]